MWTDAEKEELRQLIGQGLAFSLIGRKIGRGKNACIGKAHRLGLSKPLAVAAERASAQWVRANFKKGGHKIEPPQPVPVPVPTPPPVPRPSALGHGVTLVMLRPHQCRWLMGSGLYCGERIARYSYCEEHAEIAYRKVNGRVWA